ncbi:AraC family transcriptional regulator [Vreelandella alkaliphila]|uniref:Helix-turn-helix transcriptional regulator n=1 Tax=Vreelandella alkaliphila TaxID=272774 RepID=A0A7C9NPQ7_9GAMM|nr:helix-turn-helix transcriptional regulator [Halomonas alkaliphila]NDL68992.1 helix-turn-helix transcriptional regulator [Halomonas alkaliphila]
MTRAAIYRMTVADFLDYGHRYCIEYRFPATACPPERAAQMSVAQGRVEEIVLFPGVELVLSDIDVIHPYASHSLGSAARLLVVVIEGRVRLGSNTEQRWLTAGQAHSLCLNDRQVLDAYQPEGQRLRTLCLSLDETAMHQWCGETFPAEPSSTWSLTHALNLSLEQSFHSPLTGLPRRLLFQGLALQLLAQGQAPPSRESIQVTASPSRLESVRRLLEEAPEREHRLEVLAARAAMSPSTLVRRFKTAYGCSPIDYLRRMRLSLARELLLDGHSIQQAAHLSGYRHASNFTTAFRRAFGVSPSTLTRHHQ